MFSPLTDSWEYPGNVVDDRGSPCVTNEHGMAVCAVLDDGFEDDEVEVNARLIAAAPAMLRALKVIYRHAELDGTLELQDALDGVAEAISLAGFGVDPK